MAGQRFDMNQLMRQAQEMQAQMARAQEQLANETVEASAGGGLVTVKATGTGVIQEIKIDPKAAQSLMESKLGGSLGGLGLPGL